MTNSPILDQLSEALSQFANKESLQVGAENLLNVLGYSSSRTADVGSVNDFLEQFASDSQLTERQCRLFEFWDSVDIVFQITNEEITKQNDQLEAAHFDEKLIKSFLFLAVDMLERDHSYTRTHMAETTRAVNRLFSMPVILLFRHSSTLTLAATHRRVHQHNELQTVLERVTLVKDISVEDPNRAHIEILSELSLQRLIDSGVMNFDMLHESWENVLDIELLNKRFFYDIFDWFERATEICKFPDDGGGKGGIERHVIRLITRLLFIWFLKEKDLVPAELFENSFACSTLKNHSLDATDYYRAILQNLFFATLNTEIRSRSFFNENEQPSQAFKEFRYRDMLKDPQAFLNRLDTVPFVNGGLFDCLDDFAIHESSEKLVDAFTDNTIQSEELRVPAHLFLHPKLGLFPLFRRYKFTIEESTPLDREVALDPELLGRVFENLLAVYNPETCDTARNQTGSFYTPRPVVDYMVREVLVEALISKVSPHAETLECWRNKLQYLLDPSKEMYDDANEFFSESERQTVVAAIAEIRTLDPAVGSGAFPMGILHTLTLALRRLDPDNILWEQVQKELAKARAGKAFDVQNQSVRNTELSEISAMFEKYRQSDFGRKLYLIQNGIYGVDIQPIACQIAKLRFFISLVIEQDGDPSEPNLGIKPLPNLETQLVAADSLLDLKAQSEDLLQQADIASKLREVTAIRERYFLADNRQQKLQCIEKDLHFRKQLRNLLEIEQQIWIEAEERDIESSSKQIPNLVQRKTFRDGRIRKLVDQKRNYDKAFSDARMIAEWNPYDQNSYAKWFNAKYMFDVSEGFDVVIGNPPYIQLQKNGGQAANLYQDAGYKTFVRSGDIYQLFYERGCSLLKPGIGILAYITSNSWLKAQYGRALRQFFVNQHTPLSLVEMGRQVFENAIVDTAVLLARSGKTKPAICQAVDVEQISCAPFPPPKKDWGTLQPEGNRPWVPLSSIERAVIEKMESAGKPLHSWDISIYYGIKTGYNAAFIVDQETRDALIAEDSRSDELLKPILRGRDIARYRANWAGLWLIDTHNGYADVPPIDVDDYPAIKAHLDQFIGSLRRRQDKGVTPYNLRNCAYREEFGKEKLFWMHMTPYGRFVLAEPDVVCNQKCFMVTGMNLEYLCAVLNSKLVTWLIRRTAVTTGMGLPQWDKFTVERIPVVQPDHLVMDEIGDIVESIIIALELGDLHEVANLQRMIDSYVFRLYDLTGAEREAVSRAIFDSSPVQ